MQLIHTFLVWLLTMIKAYGKGNRLPFEEPRFFENGTFNQVYDSGLMLLSQVTVGELRLRSNLENPYFILS